MQVELNTMREEQIKILSSRYQSQSTFREYIKKDPLGEQPKELWKVIERDPHSEVSARLVTTANILKDALGHYEKFLVKQLESAEEKNTTVDPKKSRDAGKPKLPVPGGMGPSPDLFPTTPHESDEN